MNRVSPSVSVYLESNTYSSGAYKYGELWIVMEPSDFLVFYCTASNFYIWVSGAELPLPTT